MGEFGNPPQQGPSGYRPYEGRVRRQAPVRQETRPPTVQPTVRQQHGSFGPQQWSPPVQGNGPAVVHITDQPIVNQSVPVGPIRTNPYFDSSRPGVVHITDLPPSRPAAPQMFQVPIPRGPLKRPPKTWVIFSGGMNGGIESPKRMMTKLSEHGVDPNQMILLSNAFPTFVPERPEALRSSERSPETPLEFFGEAGKEVTGRAVQTIGTPINFGRNLYKYSSSQFPNSALSRSTYNEVLSALQQKGFQPGDRIGFVTHSAGAMRCRETAKRLAREHGIEPAFFTSLGSPMIEVDKTPFNGQPEQHLPESTRHVAITSPYDPVTGVVPKFVIGVQGQPNWGDANDARFTLDGYVSPTGRQFDVSNFGHCNYDAHGPAMWFLSELIKRPDGDITIPHGLQRLDKPNE